MSDPLPPVTPRAEPAPEIGPGPVPPAETPGVAGLTGIVTAVVVVAALYVGREVLLPITVAVLLSFVLSPLMELLRRIWLGRVLSALLAVVLALSVILALGGVLGSQIAGLAGDLPRYQTTIQQKVETIRGLTVDRLGQALGRLGRQFGAPQQQPPGPSGPASAAAPGQQPPVPVVVTQPAPSALEFGERFITPVLHPVATAGIVLVVAIFILLQKEDLRDRMIRLFGATDLHRTTLAMNDAARRLSRYFLTQLAINTGFGIVVATGLTFLGVPSPILWGILGGMLRFVPYIGSYIAAALPIALAAAVEPGWSLMGWTALLYVSVELIVGQAVEPLLYGHSTGLSPFAVIVAAIFWTWIWGPVGLILSTPLTLCLAVLGRHVKRMEFLDVLLSDQPALTPVESFYQRMLAGDPDEAQEQAERFLREQPLAVYYDEVVLKGLQLAAADAARGGLEKRQMQRVRQSAAELVSDLAGHEDAAETANPHHHPHHHAPGAAPPSAPLAPEWQGATPVLCVAGRCPLDEIACEMLVQLLGRHGIKARIVPHEAVSRARIAVLDVHGVALICLCHLDLRGTPSHLRFLLRRLRPHGRGARIVAGFWPQEDPVLADQKLIRLVGADDCIATLRDAVDICVRAAYANGGASAG